MMNRIDKVFACVFFGIAIILVAIFVDRFTSLAEATSENNTTTDSVPKILQTDTERAERILGTLFPEAKVRDRQRYIDAIENGATDGGTAEQRAEFYLDQLRRGHQDSLAKYHRQQQAMIQTIVSLRQQVAVLQKQAPKQRPKEHDHAGQAKGEEDPGPKKDSGDSPRESPLSPMPK